MRPLKAEAMHYGCAECDRAYPLTTAQWRCECGGLFIVAGDRPPFEPAGADAPWSMWRYKSALPFSDDRGAWRTVTMGEGATPLIALEDGALLKLDFLMPTLSFKDRGVVVLISQALEIGAKTVIVDSSGNAGTSIAAYSARAGLSAHVYVPEGTSPKKIKQIALHRATPHVIPGDRAATSRAVLEELELSEAFYASHVYNPLFYEGTKTVIFEIWEQLGGELPDTLVLPVGNGTLVLGAARGIEDLMQNGLATTRPRIIAVQAANCAPLAQQDGYGDVPQAWKATIAEGIAISAPPRRKEILRAVQASQGSILAVTEIEIEFAHAALAQRGIYVEPTSATVYAAWRRLIPHDQGRTVMVMSGAGLKAP